MSGITYYPEGLDDNTTLDETLTDGPTGDDVLAAHQNNQNAAIKALELKVGIDGSEDTSSIDYRINELEMAIGDTVDTATFNDHSARHEFGGDDVLNVSGLSGELADPQTPKSHASSHEPSGGDEIKNLSLDTLSLVQFDETLDEPAVVSNEITIDLDAGSVFVCELNDDVTDVIISNAASVGRVSSFTLVLIQDSTGGRGVTWPASILWSNGETPELPSGVGEDIVFVFFTVDGGTTWRGMESGRLFA